MSDIKNPPLVKGIDFKQLERSYNLYFKISKVV